MVAFFLINNTKYISPQTQMIASLSQVCCLQRDAVEWGFTTSPFPACLGQPSLSMLTTIITAYKVKDWFQSTHEESLSPNKEAWLWTTKPHNSSRDQHGNRLKKMKFLATNLTISIRSVPRRGQCEVVSFTMPSSITEEVDGSRAAPIAKSANLPRRLALNRWRPLMILNFSLS